MASLIAERLAALDAAEMMIADIVIRTVALDYRSQMDLNRRLLGEAQQCLRPPYAASGKATLWR